MTKKLLALCLLLSLSAACAHQPKIDELMIKAEGTGANERLTNMTQLDSGNPPASGDGFYVVGNFGGSPVSRYVLYEDMLRGGTMIATKSAAYTVGADDAREKFGGVIYLTSSATVTCPASPEEGMAFTVITIGSVTATIDPNGTDDIIRDGTAQASGVTIVSATTTAGEMAVCTYYDSTTWACQTNGWSQGS